LLPFDEFHYFFTSAIQLKQLIFSFANYEKPIDGIRAFLAAFDDRHLLWALMFIASQPWPGLFEWNQELSDLLLEYVPGFIMDNFFERPQPDQEYDLMSCDSINEPPILPSKPPPPASKYGLALPFIDGFFAFVRTQIGEGFVFLLSVILDRDSHFPSTPFVPPFGTTLKLANLNDLLHCLIAEFANEEPEILVEIYTRLFYCVIAIANADFDIDLTPVLSVVEANLDLSLIAALLSERMLKSDQTSPNPFPYIFQYIPNFPEFVRLFEDGDHFIPLEFLTHLTATVDVTDATLITENAISHSIPSHFASAFCKCTTHGALVMDTELDISQVVLLPGAIVQRGAILRQNSMLMEEVIATTGSILEEGTFASRDSVLKSPQRPIDESVTWFEAPHLKRGVVIGENVSIGEQVSIGSGAIICHNAVIGSEVEISSGCVVCEGEIVPDYMSVPPGFVYSSAVVEFAREIPEVISRRSEAFTKRLSGFVDVRGVVGVGKSGITAYLTRMRDFPRETGRGIAKAKKEIGKFLEEPETVTGIFGGNSLLLAIAYWKSGEGIEEHCDLFIQKVCERAIEEYGISRDNFTKQLFVPVLIEICSSFPVLIANGIDRELVEELKRKVHSGCDEIRLQLLLVGQGQDSLFVDSLNRVLQLTVTE
jgi:carbonic anhydrase/acetyltransferase-like protein (isoleucine patch superfamily)